MKCSGCGKGLVGDETFCPNCGMKIDQLHRPSASIEVLAPSSLDISATVKRNKRWYILAAVLLTAAVFSAGWVSHRANVKAVKEYVWKQGGDGSQKLLSVYSDLHAVRLSDQPGYSGVLGKYDAKRSGEALLAEEQQDYEAVRNRLLFVVLPSEIKKCVDVLHSEKEKEIQRVLGLAKKSFIRDTEFEAGLEAVDKNSWSKCNTAYVEIYERKSDTGPRGAPPVQVTRSTSPSEHPSVVAANQPVGQEKNPLPAAAPKFDSLMDLDLKNVSVRCPEDYTGNALNRVFMENLRSAFAPQNVDHFAANKQPRYMMNVFQDQVCGGVGQDDMSKRMCEAENKAASHCVRLEGTIYGLRIIPQPHYMARESLALATLGPPSAAYLFSMDPDQDFAIVDGAEGHVATVTKILRSLGYRI